MSTDSEPVSEFFNDTVATLGDRIEAARAAEGLSVEQLADHLGVKIETIHRWENDMVAPRANKTQMLAGVLNVSLVWLISGQSNGTDYVEQNYNNPDQVTATLNEIHDLKHTLEETLARLGEIEARLTKAN